VALLIVLDRLALLRRVPVSGGAGTSPGIVNCDALQWDSRGWVERMGSMQDQLTVRLPADLSQALKAASRRMQRKSSEVVRLALREFLGASSGSKRQPADRVRSLIGSLESGVPDLAERHRDYIIEALRRGR